MPCTTACPTVLHDNKYQNDSPGSCESSALQTVLPFSGHGHRGLKEGSALEYTLCNPNLELYLLFRNKERLHEHMCALFQLC